MPQAIFNRQSLLSCLLCIFVLMASVDRIPDPPSVKPHQDKAISFCIDSLHYLALDQDRGSDLVRTSPLLPARGFDLRSIQEEKPFFVAAGINEASDSSPPFFVS